jgi:hypothetical protein
MSRAEQRRVRERLVYVRKTGNAQMRKFVMSSGDVVQDQFKPWYFGIAFAFLFKYCAGMPDVLVWSATPRYRRNEDAPRIELPLWVELISHRVEQHL